MNNLDDIFFKSFLQEYSEQEAQKILSSKEDRKIAQQKKEKLYPIEQFLQKFVDFEVMVNHCDKYTKNPLPAEPVEPKLFHWYNRDSSKRWYPGISIFFDHPAQVEIAIPNSYEEGAVVIKVASHHPDAYILEQRFSNIEFACRALGKFLSKCTISIRQSVPQSNNNSKKRHIEFLQNAPHQPPDDLKKTANLFNKNKSEEE